MAAAPQVDWKLSKLRRWTMGQQTSLARKLDYSAPPADGDFYRIANLLDESESTIVKRVRDFMECEIAPIIDDYWARDKFPLRSFQSSPRWESAEWVTKVTAAPAAACCSMASSAWSWLA